MPYACSMIIGVFKQLLDRELRPSWSTIMIPLGCYCYYLGLTYSFNVNESAEDEGFG